MALAGLIHTFYATTVGMFAAYGTVANSTLPRAFMFYGDPDEQTPTIIFMS